MERAKAVVTDLFEASSPIRRCCRRTGRPNAALAGDAATGRVVRDYIAGMTDSYALAEYARVFQTEIVL